MTFFFQSKLMIKYVHSTGASETHQRDSAQQKRLCLIVQSLDAAGYFYCCVSGQTLEKRIKHFFFDDSRRKEKQNTRFATCGRLLTSGNFGCVLLMAWDAAFTAWASSCSKSPLVFAASHILPLRIVEKCVSENDCGFLQISAKCCSVTKTLNTNAIVQKLNYFECIQW